MNGQLNSNIYNASSNGADIEELQKQIDSLNTSVGSISEKLDETTEALNEYKAENSNQISTAEIISTSATVDNLSSNTINGTTLCINGTSNQKDINAEDIFATGNIHANNLYGSLYGGSISGSTLEVESGEVSGSLTAKTITTENVNVANSLDANTITSNSITNTGDATITGCLKAKGLELTNGASLTGNAVDVCNVLARNSICTMGNGSIDGNLEVKGNITGSVNGDITSTNANITNGTIDNLTVNGTLTVANGITLPNTLGDTTLTSVTTDKLTVNGDTELNGAVKAGSITIGDGSITAGEVCIGAKGIVIDKDKNAAFADISSSNITAENIEVNTKINASCVEAKDIVTDNTFTKNLYPENITIDKDVGELHYSRQLDTDAVGGVLVDCKTVTPKEGATGIITKYKDSESNTINPDSIEYVNEKNGIKVVSCSTTDTTTNEITFDTGTTTYGITANENSLSFKANEDNIALQILKDGDLKIYPRQIAGNSDDPFIAYSKTDGSIYCKYVNILGDACQCSSSGNNYSCKIKEENTWNCCLSTTCYRCTPTACTVGNTTETQTKYTDYLRNYDCITSNSYCLGHQNDNTIEGCTKMVSCRGQDINSFDISLSCCDCTTLAGDTTVYNSCYFETTVYDGSKISCQYIRKNSECPVYSTIKTIGCKYQMLPTTVERHLSNGSSKVCDELAWKVCINDSNLYITNPQRTTSEGCIEDILRVEDGKIYTKCGEFVAGGGGSGGYFEDATFSNNCISGTRSIVDDTITTCVVESGRVDCYSFETSTPNTICFGFGTNCCLGDSSPIPENNYKKNYFIYTPNPNSSIGCCCCYSPLIRTEWSLQSTTKCPLYKENSCYNIASNEYSYSYCQISPTSGNVVTSCNLYKSDKCTCCSTSSSETTPQHDCCRCFCLYETPNTCNCCSTFYWCQSDYCSCCCCYNYCNNNCNCLQRDITCRYTYTCFTNSSCNYTCYCNYNMKCYPSVDPAFVCTICNQYDEPIEGNETEICLGNYCSRSCNFVFNYSCNCGTLCGCSYEYDSGSYETCYACYPRYDCTSQYARYFNGDCLCGYKYNTSTCQYECFTTCSCVSISDSSIYKYLCINNSCVSLKEKIVNNQITNLPITNTLVPLAGKVNGNGFAFFCKGSDGTKFYDSSFAEVDAGSATNITYLVTTGA